MTGRRAASSEAALESRRQALQQQLAAQRQSLAGPRGPNAHAGSGFPRSMTMRLLANHPALSVGVAVKIASLVIGRWRSRPRG